MSLSRDFIYAFILGQLKLNPGMSQEEAKTNFASWLTASDVCSEDEKQKIVADLVSYNVKG